ncbi:ubiquitin recognition factor in ER-associated degradation protein 1-like [Leptonychotes weddellii]|uniref:Ubiquitin recognition factor in ER-associated degradation protein 1-like n=1 Tax=Leptonychotes weddellii TaxID=9713 RepID=A0A7F8RV26_LEPWE|nr:ubiquitin recognition factor in ER-associated degradation protein 1-like [Leptonychotes weddellii]
MMQNLLLEEGGLVQVESVNLQVATYSKFQPQSPDFLDITNPKAVLENALRNFACLTTGDVIAINYNEKIYELRVMETKPDKAVSIIECDMNVDFDAPLGYKEPERQVQHEESAEGEADHSGYAGELGFRVSTRPQFYFLCSHRAIWGPLQGLGLRFLCTHVSGTFLSYMVLYIHFLLESSKQFYKAGFNFSSFFQNF